MAHGMYSEAEPGFVGITPDGVTNFLGLDALSGYLQDEGEGIEASAIFADCCGSAQERFRAALRDSLKHRVVFIGATRQVDWHECTTFASIFYGSVLRARGKGVSPQAWVLDSAERSIEAYKTAVDGACPFAVRELAPTRRAKAAFANVRRGRGLI